PVADGHGERAHPVFEPQRRVPTVREHERRPDGRMSGERKLARGREDPQPVIATLLRGHHERGLRQVQLLRRGLHRAIVDRAAVAEHRELVAAELPVGEHVDERVLVTGHARRATASRTSSMNRSNTGSLSRGPGAPSGWYWYVRIGSVRCASPSTDPSLRFRLLTKNSECRGSDVSSTWNSWFWLVMTT